MRKALYHCLMQLTPLLPLIEKYLDPLFPPASGQPRVRVLETAKPALLAALSHKTKATVVVVTTSPRQMTELVAQLETWLGDEARVFPFPEPDVSPYEPVPIDKSVTWQRISALSALLESPACQDGAGLVFVTTVKAIMYHTLDTKYLREKTHEIKVGATLRRNTALANWLEAGYTPVSLVEHPGTMAWRGGIIDIYPVSSSLPARIELLGDEVDSIRLFSPVSQRSEENVKSVRVLPAIELTAKSAVTGLERLEFANCRPDVAERLQREISQIKDLQKLPQNWWSHAHLFNTGSFMDYLPESATIVLDSVEILDRNGAQLEENTGEIHSRLEERGELPKSYPSPLISWGSLRTSLLQQEEHILLNGWNTEDGEPDESSFGSVPSYLGRIGSAIRDIAGLARRGWRVVVVSQQAARISELLQERKIGAPAQHDLDDTPKAGSVTVLHGQLNGGWKLSGRDGRANGSKKQTTSGGGIALITDGELFGVMKQPRRIVDGRRVKRLSLPLQLEVGDYVVHIEHGIARFGGTTVRAQENGEREYLLLEYASGDRLYVPTEQLDRVTRYIGAEGNDPALTRLGTQDWARAKAKVRRAVKEIAHELLATSAAREADEGIAFSPDNTWQGELESSFPYTETPDQIEAVLAVKEDMEDLKPMDRLVCGDVGYGKTEVALRAAFKAVMDGYQVAILVPTTVLAQQHYETFSERLNPFPVSVDVVSRFRSEKEQSRIAGALANGEIDICIGTHRLIQKDMRFKNLGLVIIDEEHRFGVVHKEYLKKLKTRVDVLTLTATPIPRTLHMAMVGVRDMSTIDTPPEGRMSIKTTVLEFDERVVKEAVLRELDRGGQVFYVHNRVHDIEYVAERLRTLVPDANIVIGHGQMPEAMLEHVMMTFATGQADILLCTTIIESGLDMPNVNTIIIDHADKLGLAQMYQLRGRVGRGPVRAYAYFFYEQGKPLSEPAFQRLQTIFEATELGAGYQVAMKDLEIRGTGNLLGVEQSGQIGAVGFDLYCRLLATAVEEAKWASKDGAGPKNSEQPVLGPSAGPKPPPTVIKLPIDAHLPLHYIPDLSIRMDLYRRLLDIERLDELEELAAEISDRFGSIPSPVQELLYTVRLRVLGAAAGAQNIYQDSATVVIQLFQGIRVKIPDNKAKKLPRGVTIGTAQIRLNTSLLGERWKETVLQVLEAMGSQFDQVQPPRQLSHAR
ncbi:MAG: transcription-repair coupling factor [Dehalococcoidia bacterium]|nr:transcription-repair coupling factor [Dehalococcoidia bacterium]